MAINFTGSYSQNFDSLLASGTANSWTNNTTLAGWYLFRQPAVGTAIAAYNADNGGSNVGSFYSYGSTGGSDRALGGLGSGGAYFGSPAAGNVAGWIAFAATNTTGASINDLALSFSGEQWRNGGNTTAQTMVLEYGFGTSFETVATWTAAGSTFNWSSPVATSTAGAVDGNAAGQVSNVGGTLSGLSWANGDTLWIRWVERNDTGNDHGLAIDNFSLTVGTTPPPTTPVVTIAAPDATAAEAGTDSGTFRITRTGDTTNALTVSYTIGGSATSGDYTPGLTGTATIAAGQSFVEVTITPVDDAEIEVGETVTLTLVDAADYDLGATVTASVAIADNDGTPGAIRIRDIQGSAHISPLVGQTVSNVAGIVTAVATNGFYFQDPNPDADDSTSEGMFVFTGSAPTVAAGDSVLVNGTVAEFRPGNNANNLTITQITGPSITVLSSGNALPTAVVLGNGGRTIPTQSINNDASSGNVETGGDFDPANEGIDFYESVEGMRVQLNNTVTTSPTANFGSSEEIWVLADNGENATSRTVRGGSLITSSDFNPERIQIDDLINGTVTLPTVDVGAQLGQITGVVSYDFNNYEVLVSTAPTVLQPSTLQKEVTNLTGSANQLTVATFNVENLDPGDGAAQFAAIAAAIVNNLRSPDIISLEEIQDNNGAINDGVVDANVTLQTLIDAIAAAGGPTYEFRQLNPVDDQDGGEPGGNIRVAFLFNPNRVSFVEGSLQRLTDPNFTESDSFTGDDFASSRKPLVGTFTFNGQQVTVIGNHFNSKGGDQPLFGPNQPPTLTSENQRNQQATIVRDYVQTLLTANPTANVVVAGDLNDFEFSNPLSILENGGLNTLVETLPANERYTYNFQGNAQVLDHILVSNNLLTNLDGFDVVHINSEFADQVSDHDPVVARFNLPSANQAPTAGDDTATTDEDVAIAINVLANDVDPDGTALSVASVTQGNNGSVTINTNGTVTYTPNANFNGTDSFTYTVTDGSLTDTATVNVTVNPADEQPFVLELLHFSDQEGGSRAIQDAPRLSAVLNALRGQDLGNDGLADNTLTLSSGDMYIPGLFFGASAGAFGSAGIGDIQIQNELGVQASALGNHEFDFGTQTLARLISGAAPGTILGADFAGTAFPYLSTNLNFAPNADLAPLEVAGGQAPQARTVSSSVVINVNGENIGVVGATTPTLASISSSGTVGILPSPFAATPTPAQLDALAAEIQLEVDALRAADPTLDKIILLAHMQRIDIELALAERLRHVDIIVAGGSNTRLFDSNDRIRAGDSNQGQYPQFVTNAGGTQTAVVNTDGNYKYVGRLVMEFDADGNIIPTSYDPTVSGAYATDDQGVADLNAGGLVDPEIQQIVNAIETQILSTESNVFGISNVFLNGNRSGTTSPTDPDGVRTQETNLGNLTADANLAEAQAIDSTVLVSIKNGGGIRASIGQTIVPAGGSAAVRLPNEAVIDGQGNVIKPEGGISQNDIQTALSFNNGLSLITLTKTELVALLEHGVSAVGAGSFPQIAGVKFSYDPDFAVGNRIQSAAIFDENDNLIAELVRNSEVVGDPNQLFRVVTLDFLLVPRFNADGSYASGGDGYPFPNLNTNPALGAVGDPAVIARANVVSLVQAGVRTGDATFANNGSEQDALAEYLFDNFRTNPYNEADTGRDLDDRIQNLNFREDSIAASFNDAPVAVNDTASTTDLQSVVISVLANDTDPDVGDTLAIASFTNAANGTLVQNADNTFTYTPNAGFTGTDSFTYTVRDSGNLTSTATVTITVTQATNQIIGTNGNDNLMGTDQVDTILALAGNDTLNGGLAADRLVGGLGNDTYIVDAGDEVVEAPDEGTDLVRSSISWVLAENVENLTLIGNVAIDGTGNNLANVFTGNNANNVFRGLGGNDTYNISNANDTVVENPGEGTDLVRSSISLTLGDNVENLTLTGGNNINGTGNNLDNVLTGNGGRNRLTGLEGNDFLNGLDGNDIMAGGLGNDTYVVNTRGDRTLESANQGIDQVRSSVAWTLAANVENLTLTGNNNINGTGNTLNNRLAGNIDDNILNGGGGNDVLLGGRGFDTLIGGSGNDTFVYNALNERGDRINDFNPTQDRLDLGGLFDSLAYAGSTPIADGYLRFTRSGSTTLVQVDQNGLAGGANFSTLVTLNNVNPASLVVGSNVLI